MDTNSIIAVAIFIITFAFILGEKAVHVHRTVIAMCGAVAMVLAGTWFHFYDYKAAFAMIDLDTIGLLFGMMALLAMLEKTGAFQYLAIKVARLSRGNPLRLLFYLAVTTSVLSMFLDNVTTVVLLAPVTVLITSLLGFSPIPFLISEALLSNISGVATLVGDPPNIMIASAVKELSFMSFITHLAPHVFIIWIVAFGMIMLTFRKELAAKPKGLKALLKMNPESSLTDKPNAIKLCVLFLFIVLLFFIAEHIHLRTSIVAILGAAIGFVITKSDVEETFKSVEFPILIFFAALFVAVGGLEHSGVLKQLSTSITSLAKTNMLLCCITMIWVAAIASAIVDNIPFTIAMIPVIQLLGVQMGDPHLVTPLWWALALGVGLGGNGTHIGATANIVVVSLSEKTPTPITTLTWLKSGSLTTIASLIVATITFWLMYGHMTTR